MNRLVDNLIAYRIISMLVTPFIDTEAYRLGIIDDMGKNLKKANTLTSVEKDSYTYLHRLVFNMKKILTKLPGGDSKLKNIIAALFLIKEYHTIKDRNLSLMEDRYLRILDKVNSGVILVEEELATKTFLETPLLEDGVANVAGAAVSTDTPAPLKKNIAKYKQMVRRKKPVVGA